MLNGRKLGFNTSSFHASSAAVALAPTRLQPRTGAGFYAGVRVI
ncbi:MAG: hypothetical protein RLZZ15_3245 [Verrucomicrobiota bacterium]|jgi:hypothetical protein